MNYITLIGLLAGFLTTICYLPQAIKVYETKHTKDLSLPTFLMLTLGIILWLVYGILSSDLPIILANALTLLLSLYILWMKIKYK